MADKLILIHVMHKKLVKLIHQLIFIPSRCMKRLKQWDKTDTVILGRVSDHTTKLEFQLVYTGMRRSLNHKHAFCYYNMHYYYYLFNQPNNVPPDIFWCRLRKANLNLVSYHSIPALLISSHQHSVGSPRLCGVGMQA